MIRIENVEIVGWEAALRGMRNPMNSWAKGDTNWQKYHSSGDIGRCIGENDLKLMKSLAKAGTDHRKFMRMITVYADVTSSLYFFKEFDTYKVGTVANSCSTMHTIHQKPFTLDDFSCEHLMSGSKLQLRMTIDVLNDARKEFINTKDKAFWWQMIQLLPSSYNQKRTVMLNYEVLANMYKSRKNHKLDEWRVFCDWIKSLPYSELITGEENE